MIDTTVGIENVTWFATDQKDRRRIVFTFQDELRKGFLGGEKLPGEIELYADSKEAPYARMSVDSPELLDQLAKACEIAAQHWRHCIEACDCFNEDNPPKSHKDDGDGVKVISFGPLSMESLDEIFEANDDEDEDEGK